MKKHALVALNIIFAGTLLSIPISLYFIGMNILKVPASVLAPVLWLAFGYSYLFIVVKNLRKILALIFVVLLVAAISFLGLDIFFPKVLSVKHNGINYDSGSLSVFKSSVKEFMEDRSGISKDFKIHFRINPAKSGSYGNVFQTSGWAGGLRFEIDPKTSVPYFIVGSSKNKPESFPLPALRMGGWATFDIGISRTGLLLIYVNGNEYLETRIKNFDFKIDDILVGNGYDRNRFFNGRIEDFNITYNIIYPNPLKIYSFIIFLAIIFQFIMDPVKGLRLLGILAGLIFILFAVHSWQSRLPLKAVSQTYSEKEYDSASNDPLISKPFKFVETRGGLRKELKVSFKMKVYNIKYYPNVFQTSSLNEGARMELSPSNSQAYLIVGTGRGPFVTFPFGQTIVPGKNYEVSISLGKEGEIEAFWDGKKVINESAPYINYKIDSIIAGRGYDEGRVLDGELNNFSLRYNLYNRDQNKLLEKYLAGAIIMVALFVLAKQFLFIKNLIVSTYL